MADPKITWKPDAHGGWAAHVEVGAGNESWIDLSIAKNDINPGKGRIAWGVVIHAEDDGTCDGVARAKARALEAAEALVAALQAEVGHG